MLLNKSFNLIDEACGAGFRSAACLPRYIHHRDFHTDYSDSQIHPGMVTIATLTIPLRLIF